MSKNARHCESLCRVRDVTDLSVSIASLWFYCHRFGVNSHSVAVIATGYPVAIATAIFDRLHIYAKRLLPYCVL